MLWVCSIPFERSSINIFVNLRAYFTFEDPLVTLKSLQNLTAQTLEGFVGGGK